MKVYGKKRLVLQILWVKLFSRPLLRQCNSFLFVVKASKMYLSKFCADIYYKLGVWFGMVLDISVPTVSDIGLNLSQHHRFTACRHYIMASMCEVNCLYEEKSIASNLCFFVQNRFW